MHEPGEQSKPPILYSFRRCPYAMRARLALMISATRCELREVKLSAKPDALIAASEKATVPVLVDEHGTIVDESFDIMHWALARHDPEGWLQRSDPGLIAANDGDFKQDLDRYKYPERYGSDAMTHRGRAMDFLSVLNERLATQPQLTGQERGLADGAIFPFVRQFAAVDREWFASVPLPHLRRWLDFHLGSSLFGAIMTKRKVWEPGDEPVYFEPD